MEWKIDYIILKNFKFFKDKFALDLQRNNLLVYGENGSGKVLFIGDSIRCYKVV